MTRIVLVYGVIAGLVIIVSMILEITLSGVGHDDSLWLGYLIMFVALSMIFVGVKQYRDTALGGVIKFGLGLGIAAVASVIYVAVWEIYLAATNYTFMDGYAARMIEAKRAAGLTAEALQREIAQIEDMKVQYANLLFRLPMTFIEIFPVGLLVSLISAALLRNPKLLPRKA